MGYRATVLAQMKIKAASYAFTHSFWTSAQESVAQPHAFTALANFTWKNRRTEELNTCLVAGSMSVKAVKRSSSCEFGVPKHCCMGACKELASFHLLTGVGNVAAF